MVLFFVTEGFVRERVLKMAKSKNHTNHNQSRWRLLSFSVSISWICSVVNGIDVEYKTNFILNTNQIHRTEYEYTR